MWNGASLTLHFSIISRPICKFLICRFHGIRQRLTDQIQSFLHQKNETQKHFLWYKHKKMPPAYSSLFYFFFSARTPQRFGEIFLARLRLPSWTFLSRFTIVKFPSSRLELQFRIITHCENVFFFFRKFFFRQCRIHRNNIVKELCISASRRMDFLFFQVDVWEDLYYHFAYNIPLTRCCI